MIKYNILIIISSDRNTGAAVPALQQALSLKAVGHHIILACLSGGNLSSQADEANLSLLTSLNLPRCGQIWQIPEDVACIRQLLVDEKISLVLVHRSPETLIAGLAAKGKVPVVRFWHDGSGMPCSALNRWYLRKLDIQLVATTLAAANALGALNLRIENKPFIMKGAVDTGRFNPALSGKKLRQDLGLNAENLVVGTISRWKKGRELFTFLTCFSQAVKQNKNLVALLIGRGELENKLREKAAELGIAELVHVYNPRERFLEALGAVDIGLMLRPGSDGTARAAIEMMSAAKPMVLSGFGSLPELAQADNEATALVGNNQNEIVSALLCYAKDKELRLKYGLAARRLVENSYSPGNSQKKLDILCAFLLNKKNSVC